MKTLKRLAILVLLVLAGGLGRANGQPLTNLYSFTGGSDGANPEAGLVQGSDGNFYGTTDYGGTGGWGTVYRISSSGSFTNLHSFNGSDGAYPYAGPVQGIDGNFYGTAAIGGANDWGTVYRISPSGSLSNLYSFTGGSDGATPWGLVQGRDSNFYGITWGGANASCPGNTACGSVFRISPDGILTNLHSFGFSDGFLPQARLLQGNDGNFYGTTREGGNTNLNGGDGYGTVFRISPSGSFTNLHSFSGNDGGNPEAGLVQGSDGNFYGTTHSGGASSKGTVFRISPSGSFTNLHSFNGNDGANPLAGLVQGSDGNFYGTTDYGGTSTNCFSGCGTVFRISPSGSFTNLHSFNGSDGAYPYAAPVQGSDGNFYGTTEGGTSNNGTVFQLSVPLNPPANQIAGIEFFSVFGDVGVAILIPSVAGETYQLQYSDSMAPAYWFNTDDSITSIGGSLTLFDVVGVLPPQRFYRAVITP